MGNFTGGTNLRFEDLRISEGGLFGRSAKKAANKEIKAACTNNNKGVDTTMDKGKASQVEFKEGEDETDYTLDEGEEGQEIGEDKQDSCEDVTAADGEAAMPTLEEIGELAAANNAQMEEMQATCEEGKEELAAQIAEDMTIIQDAGVQIAANMEEAQSIMDEVEQMSAGGGAEGGGEEGGAVGFGTSMAAAGGENSAYGLNIPSGNANPAPKKAGKKQGGLISSGQPATPAAGTQGAQGNQGAQANAPAQASQGGGQDIQAKLARLAEISKSNTELQTVVETASAHAIEVQTLYAEDAEFIAGAAEESNAVGEQNVEQLQQQDQTFDQIVMYGQITDTTGKVTQATGTGMQAAGTAIQASGGTLSATGATMKGISGGLKALAAALTGGVYTAPAGGAVGASGASVGSAGTAVGTAGKVTTNAGKGVTSAGKTVHTIGKGVSAVGQGAVAVGNAGKAVVAIKNGDWMSAIGAGLSCLGAAAGCLNDSAAFAEGIGAAQTAIGKAVTDASKWVDDAIAKVTGLSGGASNMAKAAASKLSMVPGLNNAAGTVSQVTDNVNNNAYLSDASNRAKPAEKKEEKVDEKKEKDKGKADKADESDKSDKADESKKEDDKKKEKPHRAEA